MYISHQNHRPLFRVYDLLRTMRPTTTSTNTLPPSKIATNTTVSETAMATADPVPVGGVMPDTDKKRHISDKTAIYMYIIGPLSTSLMS